jgi:hypothetical protein
MLSKFFKPKIASAPPDPPGDDDPLVVVPIPPLVTLLVALEEQKGTALTQEEVLNARNGAVCMTMRRTMAWKMAEQRGYRDFDPENIWDEWQSFQHPG